MKNLPPTLKLHLQYHIKPFNS